MKIIGKNPSVNLEAYQKSIRNRNRVNASGKPSTPGVSREDKVVLSPEVKRIQEAKKLLSSVPDIREEKVAQIKARIESGTYQVEEKELAKKMIKESLLNELL
ncbi:MAG: flagellar biosynthesis anti-sigma factor FlgM [Desulfatiglandaceae bacterium]|jgi:negative regulator of flagellin synthesis FlgM